jgi:hypothetical protein
MPVIGMLSTKLVARTVTVIAALCTLVPVRAAKTATKTSSL